jgi:hypothetical protein
LNQNQSHAQYRLERALIERKARHERAAARERQTHEWRIMLAEKLLIGLIVGAGLAGIAVFGNIFVERYKTDSVARQERLATIRTASNNVWPKLASCEASVSEMGSAVQMFNLHRNLSFFRDDVISDKNTYEAKRKQADSDFTELWNEIQAQKLNLGAVMTSRFFRSMQDLVILKNIYEDKYNHPTSIASDDKINSDAEEAMRNDLDKQEKELGSIIENLY